MDDIHRTTIFMNRLQIHQPPMEEAMQQMIDADPAQFYYLKNKFPKQFFRSLKYGWNPETSATFCIFISSVYFRVKAVGMEKVYPQFTLLLSHYENVLAREIILPALTPEKGQTEGQKRRVPSKIEQIYWRVHQQHSGNKRELGQQEQKMQTAELNSFVAKATISENMLQNSQKLQAAKFVYKNAKITDLNNSCAKVVGLGEKKGRFKDEQLKRICALANAGRGILVWGVNEETDRVEGIKMDEKLRKKVLAQSHQWKKEFYGGVLLKHKFIPVRADPFCPESATNLYVLATFVEPENHEEPENQEDKFFAVKIKDIAGRVTNYEAYIFNKKGKIKEVKGQKIYKLMLKSYDKTPLKKFQVEGETLLEVPLQHKKLPRPLKLSKSQLKQKQLEEDDEDPFFFTGLPDDDSGTLLRKVAFKNARQSVILAKRPIEEVQYKNLKHHLEKVSIFVEIHNLYPKIEGEKKVRVMSHNEKLIHIKHAAGNFKRKFKFQKITHEMTTLENDYPLQLRDWFRQQFEKELFVLRVNNDKELYIRCDNLKQSTFVMTYLENHGFKTHFLRTL